MLFVGTLEPQHRSRTVGTAVLRTETSRLATAEKRSSKVCLQLSDQPPAKLQHHTLRISHTVRSFSGSLDLDCEDILPRMEGKLV